MTTSRGVSAPLLLLSTQPYITHLNKGAAGSGKGRAATCKWWQESCMFAPCAHVAVPGPGGERGASAVCLLVASCYIQSDKGNRPCGPGGHCFSCLTWSQQMIYLSLCVDFGTGIKNLVPSEHKLFQVYVGLNVIKTIKLACSANLTVHSLNSLLCLSVSVVCSCFHANQVMIFLTQEPEQYQVKECFFQLSLLKQTAARFICAFFKQFLITITNVSSSFNTCRIAKA